MHIENSSSNLHQTGPALRNLSITLPALLTSRSLGTATAVSPFTGPSYPHHSATLPGLCGWISFITSMCPETGIEPRDTQEYLWLAWFLPSWLSLSICFRRLYKLDIGLHGVLKAVSPAPPTPYPDRLSHHHGQIQVHESLTPGEETIGRTGTLLRHSLHVAFLLVRKGAS